jgi:hypothetical protein
MDRRALFFLGSALVCLVLVPVTPSDLRWFALVLAGVYLVLAAGSALDNWSRRRHPPPRR